MLLEERFALAKELSKNMGIEYATFPFFIKKYNLEEFEDYIKVGGTLFIDPNSKKFPLKFREKMKKAKKTSFNDKILVTELQNLGLSRKQIQTAFKDYIQDFVEISEKEFILLNEKGKTFFKNKTIYILNEEELKDSIDCIEGFIKISKNKFLVYY